ncbi:DNA polymerase iota isoform X4 [Gracilinanus agilis]|uniref:DNA polymerase iota isoform X4 n=1 Tax=Gracilinanus agilis TaxID=191870 RepID=UPI001CFCA8FF|nr:DNA polymerase iota isoform X4 [Gracilinanus agilis]
METLGVEPEEEDEEEEDEEEDRMEPLLRGAAGGTQAVHNQVVPAGSASYRVIVHVDLDCFYAQVEMISHPELKGKPLGVQQKYLVVTCNYEARKLGVKKLMSVRDAKEKCPQLVLVNGEDLTRYREMSYKVTELLEEFSPVVERLGFDENFVDVTQTVEKRLQQLQSDDYSGVVVSGHVYNNQCIGFKTTKRLESLGINSVHDLQTFSPKILEKELGISVAQRIQKLSFGEDNSPVTPSGPPQSFSEEDSFKKCSSEVEAKKKIEELLASLLNRVCKDGRKPHTIRLIIRRFSSDRHFNRESRQCPIPSHVIQKLGTGNYDVMTPMVDILMKLFRNMVNVKMPFHLTLLSVCFSNLKSLPTSKKGSIEFYLTPSSSTPSHSGKRTYKMKDTHMEEFTQDKEVNWDFLPSGRIESIKTGESPLDTANFTKEKEIHDFPLHSLPEGIDHEVFKELPVDIQEEILSGKTREKIQGKGSLSCPLHASKGVLSFFSSKQMHDIVSNPRDHLSSSKQLASISTSEPGTSGLSSSGSTYLFSRKESLNYLESELRDERMSQGPKESQGFHFSNTNPSVSIFHSFPNLQSQQLFSKNHSADSHKQLTGSVSQHLSLTENRDQESAEEEITFPSGIDPAVFFELPEDVQKELLAEWKRTGSSFQTVHE